MDASTLTVAPAVTYARRRTICDCAGNVRRWHAYVDGMPQCRHTPALDEAAEVCAERPARVCRFCARAVGADERPGMREEESDGR